MQIEQLADDLQFVRRAVEGQETRRTASARAVPLIWAGYVLIGYALIDAAPRAANWFFLIGGVAGAIASGRIARRASLRAGVRDERGGRLVFYRTLATVLILILTAFGLATAIPSLRGVACGQVIVAMVGIVYFQAGLWGPAHVRHLLWGGPIVILGAIAVGFVPHLGWTMLGIVVAAIIIFPLLRAPRIPSQLVQARP